MLGPVIPVLLLLCCQVLCQDTVRFQRQAGGGCVTARQESGTCINIRQCPEMVELLKNAQSNRTYIEYLRGSTCGYEGRNPKVCCPTSVRIQPPVTGGQLRMPPSCGKTLPKDIPRIVDGRPAELGAWPWMVALGFKARSSPKLEWLCGATLISEQHVITAAHCTMHPRLTLTMARLGDLDLNPNIADGASPVDIPIEKVIRHDKYNTVKFTDDIALLRLERPVTFTTLIQPICLPTTAELRSNNFVKYNPFISGWGSVEFRGPSSTHLLEIQLPIITNNECQDKYKVKKAEITNRQMCAGLPKGGKDACQGDSGGPMMLPKGETFYLIGVVSYGVGCADAAFPGVYTRVSEYIEWISNNLN